MATNFEADEDIRSTFDSTIESIRDSGITLVSAEAPLYDPRSGSDNIRHGRKRIASDTFRDIDVLLLPTTVSAVPKLANVRGNANGLPAGLQIVCRPDDELTVLAVAYALQQRWSSPSAALDLRS